MIWTGNEGNRWAVIRGVMSVVDGCSSGAVGGLVTSVVLDCDRGGGCSGGATDRCGS